MSPQVGYTIRFEDCTSNETLIKYMTDGLYLSFLMHIKIYRFTTFYTRIFIIIIELSYNCIEFKFTMKKI